jgi:oligo-1,6-glucosidase
MRNVPRSWGPEEYIDIVSSNWYNEVKREREATGKPFDMEDIMDLINKKSRDNARTPVQVSLLYTLFQSSDPLNK